MSAEAQYLQLAAEVQSLPSDDKRYRAFGSAADNCTDTVREGSIEDGTADWFQLFVTTYYCALDDQN